MGPLAGIRVVDFTTMVSGPLAAATLADQGAEVIKVESPAGDETRRIGRRRNGLTASFFACNRGKRSLCIDLKRPEAAAPVRKLIESADVLMQNFRPGAMQRPWLGRGGAAGVVAEADLRLHQRLRRARSLRPPAGL